MNPVGYVIAERGARGRILQYVPRVWTTRTDAELALDDLLRHYPLESPWRRELFVSVWPPIRVVK